MQVVILAGGLGTRLRQAVADRPKPMADINGKPFLFYVIEEFKRKGYTDFLLLVGYMWENISNYFGDGEREGVNIKYSVEKKPLGTAGAVGLAVPFLDETFILVNGDTLVPFPGTEMVDFHQNKQAEITVMLTSRRYNRCEYGNIIVDGTTGIVNEFIEKPEDRGAFGSGVYINAGIYLCKRSVFTDMPKEKEVSLEKDILPAMIERKGLYGFTTDAEFIDIGIPERFFKFIRDNYRDNDPR